MKKPVEIEARLVTHYAHRLKSLNDQYKEGGNSIEIALDKYDLDSGQILHSMELAFNHANTDLGWVEMAVFFATGGANISYLKIPLKEFENILEKSLHTLEKYENSNLNSKELVLSNLGLVKHRLGNVHEALNICHRALVIATEINHIDRISGVCINIGGIYYDLGNMEKCIEYSQRGFDLAILMDNKVDQGNALINLGLANKNKKPRKAVAQYQKALQIFESAGDFYGQSKVLLNIGVIEDELGNILAAQKTYERALLVCEKLGHKTGCVTAIKNLGTIDFQNQNYIDARKKAKDALKLAEEINDVKSIVMLLADLANINLETGDLELAKKQYEDSLTIAQHNQFKDQEAIALSGLAYLYKTTSDVKKAIDYYNKAIVILKQTQNLRSEGEIRYNLAMIFVDMENDGLAARYLETACEIFEQTKHPLLLSALKMLDSLLM